MAKKKIYKKLEFWALIIAIISLCGSIYLGCQEIQNHKIINELQIKQIEMGETQIELQKVQVELQKSQTNLQEIQVEFDQTTHLYEIAKSTLLKQKEASYNANFTYTNDLTIEQNEKLLNQAEKSMQNSDYLSAKIFLEKITLVLDYYGEENSEVGSEVINEFNDNTIGNTNQGMYIWLILTLILILIVGIVFCLNKK